VFEICYSKKTRFLQQKMTDSFLIEVECHSGYKANEYPKCFYWYEKKYEIKEILDRWYQGNLNPEFPPANYFKVLTTRDKQFIIKQETESDKWYLVG
jgi:hypothetical protein